MGSVGAPKVQDPYFKTDWESGTGPNSLSFKEALAYAKRNVDNEKYSWAETVEDAQTAYYLSDEEASVMEDKLKMYAINRNIDEYRYKFENWLDDFKRRGIKVTKRRTKLEKELDEL